MAGLGFDIKEMDFVPEISKEVENILNYLDAEKNKLKKGIGRYHEEGDVESVLFTEGMIKAYESIYRHIVSSQL